MQPTLHIDSSGAGLFPVSIEVTQHKRGVELHLRVGGWGVRSVIPRSEITRVAADLQRGSSTETCHKLSWRSSDSRWNRTTTRIWVREAEKDIARCYLAICVGPFPMRATMFSLEKHKLAALGLALTASI